MAAPVPRALRVVCCDACKFAHKASWQSHQCARVDILLSQVSLHHHLGECKALPHRGHMGLLAALAQPQHVATGPCGPQPRPHEVENHMQVSFAQVRPVRRHPFGRHQLSHWQPRRHGSLPSSMAWQQHSASTVGVAAPRAQAPWVAAGCHPRRAPSVAGCSASGHSGQRGGTYTVCPS